MVWFIHRIGAIDREGTNFEGVINREGTNFEGVTHNEAVRCALPVPALYEVHVI